MDTTFSQDFRDLLIALRDAEARFVVVGGYAVAIHGRPRGNPTHLAAGQRSHHGGVRSHRP
jgi:hypothetical protein